MIMDCKCESCVRKDCTERTKQDDLRIVIACDDYTEQEHKMTNADRIRAMSDEELAAFLDTFGCCHHCSEHERLSDNRFLSDERCDEKCVEHCLEWLKQPAEDAAYET
jgi:hypothetical protein